MGDLLMLALAGVGLLCLISLWAGFVQKHVGATRAGFAVYMAGIILLAISLYVML